MVDFVGVEEVVDHVVVRVENQKLSSRQGVGSVA